MLSAPLHMSLYQLNINLLSYSQHRIDKAFQHCMCPFDDQQCMQAYTCDSICVHIKPSICLMSHENFQIIKTHPCTQELTFPCAEQIDALKTTCNISLNLCSLLNNKHNNFDVLNISGFFTRNGKNNRVFPYFNDVEIIVVLL